MPVQGRVDVRRHRDSVRRGPDVVRLHRALLQPANVCPRRRRLWGLQDLVQLRLRLPPGRLRRVPRGAPVHRLQVLPQGLLDLWRLHGALHLRVIPLCTQPDMSKASCLLGGGDCDGY